MYKILCELANYKFNVTKRVSNRSIVWFKMIDRTGFCLTEEESVLVIAYFNSRKDNFSNITKSECDNGECPKCSTLPLVRASEPSNLMLTDKPLLSTGVIYNCMFIELLSSNGMTNHGYDLPFDLIGTYA